MSFLDFINPFNKVADIVSEAVEDVDKSNELRAKIVQLGEQVYLQELQTKTVPWVDALHKMGRQITGYLGYALAFYMVKEGYDPMAAMAAVAPGGIYAAFKNKGK